MHGGQKFEDQRNDLRSLLVRVTSLRDAVQQEGAALFAASSATEAAGAADLANLADYLALRRHDLSDLQVRLAAYGLSSLGRSELKVLPMLDALIASLRRICGEFEAPYPSEEAMRAGEDALTAQCETIFGAPSSAGPRARIVATFPSEAATDPALVERLLAAGMDCARINCAHDDAISWGRMIANVRAAERRLGRTCRVLMDVAGPKCRIETVRAPQKFRIQRGDRLTLAARLNGGVKTPVAITPTFPQVVDQLVVGAEVWINDGKIGTRVIEKAPGLAVLDVFSARSKGERLKPEKGLNFPMTELRLSPLTAKDYEDLDFVALHADLVGFSFVQQAADVELLQDHLAARRGDKPPQPLVLKIETPLAVRNLPQLIRQSVAHNPTAVMIARGDLAVELGFARLSEMQEEILWLCDAAHVPVIWATQVLDNYVGEEVMTRAETTDAAMAQRAEAVMLNKGPYLADGVAFLRDVLIRMDRHYAKKFARFTPLSAWR